MRDERIPVISPARDVWSSQHGIHKAAKQGDIANESQKDVQHGPRNSPVDGCCWMMMT